MTVATRRRLCTLELETMRVVSRYLVYDDAAKCGGVCRSSLLIIATVVPALWKLLLEILTKCNACYSLRGFFGCVT